MYGCVACDCRLFCVGGFLVGVLYGWLVFCWLLLVFGDLFVLLFTFRVWWVWYVVNSVGLGLVLFIVI